MNSYVIMRWSLVFGLWVTTGVSQEQPVCSTNEALQRIGSVPFLHPVEQVEARVANAKTLLDQVGLECIPSLIEILSDQKATPSAKTQAARAVGILGIVHDASTAVPALTKLVESFEGQVLDATQTALLFYSHIAIAEIGTAEARNFLYQRCKGDFWKTHEGFGKASATKTPPQIVAQGLAIASIAYLGDRDAEDYILDLFRSQEFRESTEEYRGFDLREGDLRWKLTGAILEVLQEKRFKTEVRALVDKKR